MSISDERALLSCLRSCDSTVTSLTKILNKVKQSSKKQDQYTIDNTLKYLSEISSLQEIDSQSYLGLLCEKIAALKTASEV